jgi:pimeloyl-ACP methyl ester carboxylesterase
MADISHRIVETNEIRMHIAEQGKGPLVILCHGFPELWYSWRHQLPALAQAGFHAVAPDQRGYGQTDRPEAIEEYNILKLTGDIVGLVHALGEEKAVIVGHDWGAGVASRCALLRPDIFHALVLSSPYHPRSWVSRRPTDELRQMAGEREFYQLYFQEPGRAEQEFEEDVRKTMLMFLYSGSGGLPRDKRTMRFLFDKSQRFIDTGSLPDTLPPWLTDLDVSVFAREFERAGFRGGLNWYRNIDRNWELTYFLNGAKIYQPTLFLAGQFDGVIYMSRSAVETLETWIPNLRKKLSIPGAGHWVWQEKPDEVNKLLIEFLIGL